MGSNLSREEAEKAYLDYYNKGYSDIINAQGRKTAGVEAFAGFVRDAIFNTLTEHVGKYYQTKEIDLGNKAIHGNFVGGNFSGGRMLKQGEKLTRDDVSVRPVDDVDSWAKSHDIAYNLALSFKDEQKRKSFIEQADRVFIQKYKASKVNYLMLSIEAALFLYSLYGIQKGISDITKLSNEALGVAREFRTNIRQTQEQVLGLTAELAEYLGGRGGQLNPGSRTDQRFFQGLRLRYPQAFAVPRGATTVNIQNFNANRDFFIKQWERTASYNPQLAAQLRNYITRLEGEWAQGKLPKINTLFNSLLLEAQLAGPELYEEITLRNFQNLARDGNRRILNALENQDFEIIGNMVRVPRVGSEDYFDYLVRGNKTAVSAIIDKYGGSIEGMQRDLNQLYRAGSITREQYDRKIAEAINLSNALAATGNLLGKRTIESSLGFGAAKAFDLLLEEKLLRPKFDKLDLNPDDVKLYIDELRKDELDQTFVKSFLNEYVSGILNNLGTGSQEEALADLKNLQIIDQETYEKFLSGIMKEEDGDEAEEVGEDDSSVAVDTSSQASLVQLMSMLDFLD